MVRIKTYISWCEILQTYWLIIFFKWHIRYLNFRMPIFYHTFCVVNAVSLLLLKGSRIIPLLFKSTCMTYLYIFSWINGMLQNENNIAFSLILCFKKQLTPRYINIFRKINTLLLFRSLLLFRCEFCTMKIYLFKRNTSLIMF